MGFSFPREREELISLSLYQEEQMSHRPLKAASVSLCSLVSCPSYTQGSARTVHPTEGWGRVPGPDDVYGDALHSQTVYFFLLLFFSLDLWKTQFLAGLQRSLTVHGASLPWGLLGVQTLTLTPQQPRNVLDTSTSLEVGPSNWPSPELTGDRTTSFTCDLVSQARLEDGGCPSGGWVPRTAEDQEPAGPESPVSEVFTSSTQRNATVVHTKQLKLHVG